MRKRRYWAWKRAMACLLTASMALTLPGVPAFGAIEAETMEMNQEERQNESEKILKVTSSDAIPGEVATPSEAAPWINSTALEKVVSLAEDSEQLPLQLYVGKGVWKSYTIGELNADETLKEHFAVTKNEEGKYVLSLNKDVTGYTPKITGGEWVIDLNGHTWTRTQDESIRFTFTDAEVTIQNGSLDYKIEKSTGMTWEMDIFIGSKVTFEKIEAVISGLKVENSTLTVDGGSLKSSGKGSQQVLIWDKGKVSVKNNADVGLEQVTVSRADTALEIQNSTFTSEGLDITGDRAKVTVTGENSKVSTGTIHLNGGKSILEVDSGQLTIRSECYLKSSIGSLTIKSGAVLQVDGDISSLPSDRLEIEDGATIKGTGTIPEKNRQTLTLSQKQSVEPVKADTIIDVSKYVETDPIASDLTYQVSNVKIENGTGTATAVNDGADGKIEVKGTGTLTFDAQVKSGLFKSGTISISLDVVKNQWDASKFKVVTCQGIYDGKDHDLIENITYAGTSCYSAIEVWYKETGSNAQEYQKVADHPLTVKNVKDNQKQYSLKLVDPEGLYDELVLPETYSGKIHARDLGDLHQVIVTLPEGYSETEGPVYNGENQAPAITVSTGTGADQIVWQENTDYTLKWKNWDKNVSECVDASWGYCVIVKPADASEEGNFTGSAEKEFCIRRRPIDINVENTSKVYDGTTDAPEDFRVRMDENSILPRDNRLVGWEYQKSTSPILKSRFESAMVGEKLIHFSGEYYLTGERRENYTFYGVLGTIEPADITNTSVVQNGTLTYNGAPQTPQVTASATTVKPADDQNANQPSFYYSLDPDADISTYTSEVPAVTEAGIHTVYYVVKADNHNTSPRASFPVTVEKGSLESAEFTIADSNKIYNRAPQPAEVTVTLNGYTVDPANYQVLYTDMNGNPVETPQDAGTYQVRVTASENGSCTGAISSAQTYTISQKSIEGCKVKVVPEKLSYNGEYQQPAAIEVWDGDSRLESGTEFDLKNIEKGKDAGSYDITIDGVGNYTGKLNAAYSIGQADLADASVTVDGVYVYNGKSHRPAADQIHVILNGKTLDPSIYTISYGENINAGENAGTVTVTAKKNTNYTGSAVGTFTIEKAEEPDDGGNTEDPDSGNTGGADSGNTGGSDSGNTGGSDSGNTGGSNSSSSDDSDSESGEPGSSSQTRRLGNLTQDSKKGHTSSKLGILTGAYNKRGGDGYSHWIQDQKGWWLCYNDGTYPRAVRAEQNSADGSATQAEKVYAWEFVDGHWYAFNEEGYMVTGWILHKKQWYYLDASGKMCTGWLNLGDKNYYLDPNSGAWVENK